MEGRNGTVSRGDRLLALNKSSKGDSPETCWFQQDNEGVDGLVRKEGQESYHHGHPESPRRSTKIVWPSSEATTTHRGAIMNT
ncbi:uncharacterized protein N7479_010500 [Penicillium vulpinum]|uniref:uncharacterized protein n=1 Tax=Penicillium vulpinum TaxID=29845 RepID=UPI002546BD26|nr:uncharacterized protein N7479_010500 [Penicillium vulpinum]KAJ5952087.1 hypothetical protein N7479_010500 [Penicillium vulpinum]